VTEENSQEISSWTVGLVIGSFLHDLNNQVYLLLNLADDNLRRSRKAANEDSVAGIDVREIGGRIFAYLDKIGQLLPAANPNYVDSLRLEPLRVADVVAQIHENIFVDVTCDTSLLDWKVRVAPELFGAVLNNLVDNARKADPRVGLGNVHVRVHSLNSDTLEIEVIDYGPGVPSEVQKDLFIRPLRRTAIGHSKHGKGVGLLFGRSLVEMWGGKLELKSPGPGGTVFAVTLPCLATPEPNVEVTTAPETNTPAAGGSGDQLDGLKVLIVDDDPNTARVLADIAGIEIPGATIYQATDAADAAMLAHENVYDLAIIDVYMGPGEPMGLSIVERIRRRHTDSLIVVVSGFAHIDDVTDAYSLGADYYLRKQELATEQMREILLAASHRRAAHLDRSAQVGDTLDLPEGVKAIIHELRSPLVTIMRLVERERMVAQAHDVENSEQSSDFPARVESEARRALSLVTAHLAAEALGSRREEIRPVECRASQMLTHVADAYSTRCQLDDVTISVDCPEDMVVFVDELAIQAALSPILDNALRYSARGGSVSVRARLLGEYLEVVVTDDGPASARLTFGPGACSTPRGCSEVHAAEAPGMASQSPGVLLNYTGEM